MSILFKTTIISLARSALESFLLQPKSDSKTRFWFQLQRSSARFFFSPAATLETKTFLKWNKLELGKEQKIVFLFRLGVKKKKQHEKKWVVLPPTASFVNVTTRKKTDLNLLNISLQVFASLRLFFALEMNLLCRQADAFSISFSIAERAQPVKATLFKNSFEIRYELAIGENSLKNGRLDESGKPCRTNWS